MDIEISVPKSKSERVRTGIYLFINSVSEQVPEDDPIISVTILPEVGSFLYSVKIVDQDLAGAFMAYLPSIFDGPVIGSAGAAH